MNDRVLKKLKVLSNSAKYDVSCASSGVTWRNNGKFREYHQLGNLP